MVDKTLRIGIDSSQAEAGAKRVIANLKAIQAEAAKTVGVKVPVSIDTSSISAAMAEVNKALRGIRNTSAGVKIPVGFDTSNLDSETAALVRKIKDEVDRNTANGVPIETSLKVATDAAEAEINRVLSGQTEQINVDVHADTTAAETEIDRLANGRKPTLDFIVGADTFEFDTVMADIAADKPDAIEVPVDIDEAQARAEIDALSDSLGSRRPEIKVDVDIDTDAAVSGGKEVVDVLEDIGDTLGDLSGEASKSAKSLKEIEDAAKKAAHSAEDLGDAMDGAFQQDEALELLGEALLAIATSIGTAIVAFEDYQDAVRSATGDSEAAGVAMEMIEQFAADTAFSIEDVTAAFVKFRSAGLEASRESLTSYGNVAAGLNLTMEELAAAVGQAAQGSFSSLNQTQLKAVESGDKVKFTYQGVTTTVDNTGKAVAAFIKQMGNTEFAGLMEEQADGVTGALEAMAEAWHELSRDMGEGGLSQGLIEFSHSMKDASEAADQLGRILGGWLGAEMTALGNFVETTVKEINALIDAFKWLGDAIDSLPSISGALSGAKDWLSSNVMPNLLVKTENAGEEQGPPTDPNRTNAKAFGSDSNLPRKPKKTKADTQAEAFRKENAANQDMIRTLEHMDAAYGRGRESVLGWRNALAESADKTSLASKVGEKNAQVLFDQRVEMRRLKEELAFKGEVMDQSEAIAQTDELADAYLQGSQAVQQAEARQAAWNTAVSLGKAGASEYVDQLYKLADAAAMANARLAMSKDIAGMDEQINQTRLMNDAISDGKVAEQEARIAAEARSLAIKGGYENDELAVKAIEDKVRALHDEQAAGELAQNVMDRSQEMQDTRELTEAYKAGGDSIRQVSAAIEARNIAAAAGKAEDEGYIGILREQITLQNQVNDALRVQQNLREGELDLEQGYAELENLNLVGEAYYVATERLDMLMQKKRETGDVTATLTAEEEALAAALGRMDQATAQANDALGQYMRKVMDTEQGLRDLAASGLMSFEDALVDIVTGAKSAKEAFADMAKQMAADLARMAIRMAVMKPLMMMFGGMMGGGAGVAASTVGGGIYHTGGIVGTDPVPIRPMATWPKFHTGGLATNETPAILQRGEGVFTANQMRALAPANNNTTGLTVVNNINVTAPQGGDRAGAENQANIIGRMVSQAVDERLTAQLRPGGILNANGGAY